MMALGVQAHLGLLDDHPIDLFALAELRVRQEVIEAEQERRELALARRPGHEGQVHVAIHEPEAPGMLRVVFDTDLTAVEDGGVDLRAKLPLQALLDREEGAGALRAEAFEEVLTEDARQGSVMVALPSADRRVTFQDAHAPSHPLDPLGAGDEGRKADGAGAEGQGDRPTSGSHDPGRTAVGDAGPRLEQRELDLGADAGRVIDPDAGAAGRDVGQHPELVLAVGRDPDQAVAGEADIGARLRAGGQRHVGLEDPGT